MSSRRQLSCGRDFCCVPSLTSALEQAGKCGFDFVSIPLVHPRYKRNYITSDGSHKRGSVAEPLTRNDLILPSNEWMSLVVGKISPWIHVDCQNKNVRKNSEKAFLEELTLSTHLNIPVVLIALSNDECVNLARCLMTHCGTLKGNQGFWIHVPMNDSKKVFESSTQEQVDTWEWWNKLRRLCDNDRRLSLALEVGRTIPSNAVRRRWLGEPVKALILSTDLFVINRTGFPVLRRSHQDILRQFFKFEVQFVLTGTSQSDHGLQSYHRYLDHLYQDHVMPDNMDVFAKGYNDYLQNPLQPLMDNLDSHTYEVFEKDPVKYKEYERAIALALSKKADDVSCSDIDKNNLEIVIMVVGAGRGPLVEASLKAAAKCKVAVRIYAVEKNPGAVVTLRNRQKDEWGSAVTVVSCDMRHWEAPEKAEILVSELLGSFGDNELSPECLDGAQRFLKDGGISIPSVYNSFLAPLSAPKLYSSIDDCRERDKKYSLAHYETPYVVRLWNAHLICHPKKCFTFYHPKTDTDNSRYVCLVFKNGEVPVVVHGFAGYFDTVLYGPVTLSILPETQTDGMISWFPIFFPFKKPVYVCSYCTMEIHVWRCSSSKNVWYEWALTQPETSDIHNAGGRSYWIGL